MMDPPDRSITDFAKALIDERIILIKDLPSGAGFNEIKPEVATGDLIGFVDSDDWIRQHIFKH